MIFHRPGFLAVVFRWLCGLLLLAATGEMARAQTAQPERWLLVFDTSSAMKKYLPATKAAVRQILSTSAGGQLQKDASVGVWSYGQRISGQFKTYDWEPENARQIETNLMAYLNQQRYGGDSSLSALQSPLSRLIAGSERLTVVIFCDGQSPIRFTPYDDGVNQSFHDGLDERKKSQQPFVVVVRSQTGKFIGCTVNYPPGGLNLPDFPPLPKPAPTNAPPQPKVEPQAVAKAEVPSLIIVGTKVGTNLNSLTETAKPPPNPAPVVHTNPPAKPSAVQPATNSPSAINSPVATNNSVVAVEPPEVKKTVASPKTNLIAAIQPVPTNGAIPAVTTQATVAAVLPVPTNATPVAAAKEPAQKPGALIAIGIALMLVAIALAGFLIQRGQRPRASLITSSMQDQPPGK